MKDFEYYRTNPVQYPQKNDYTKVYQYHAGKVVFEGTYWEWQDWKSTEEPEWKKYTLEKVVDEDGFKKQREKYYKEQARLTDEYKNDLFREFDVQSNPKRDKCYSIAWDHGHSSGWCEEIYNWFSELVELIK